MNKVSFVYYTDIEKSFIIKRLKIGEVTLDSKSSDLLVREARASRDWSNDTLLGLINRLRLKKKS
jgi:hypothetical protein